ncbi:unnamed protein product [Medioppia subpectinata]|uniref:NR LBD domain-containing protein n=1 Tax=Medioppia subpectinata TaxID=1979941 RepID=A0A7R9L439_9ACAR|nr:unnamed protein product [Medioppia subpectinata]CAG2114959.1 unnamed protein product [Medioppia subpectinata]
MQNSTVTNNNGKHQDYTNSDISSLPMATLTSVNVTISDIIPYVGCVTIDRPLSDYLNQFTEMEGIKLTELFASMAVYREPIIPAIAISLRPLVGTDMFDVVFGRLGLQLISMIEMCKQLTGFKSICDDDQMSYLGSVDNFDPINNRWMYKMDNTNALMVYLSEHGPNIADMFKKFLHGICYEWDSDGTLMVLLTAIILFNPNRPSLIHREVVKFQQYVYKYLLKRYLLLKYRTEFVSQTKYTKLMDILTDLQHLGESQRQLVSE